MADKPAAEGLDLPRKWSANARAMVTSLIIIHAICVVIVLSANVAPAGYQAGLVRAVAPYTRVLNFDPNFTRFHWTHATRDHDDHRIVFEFGEDQAPVVHMYGMRGSSRRIRYQVLADYMAFFSDRESDDVTALLARDLGATVLRQDPSIEQIAVTTQWFAPPEMTSLQVMPEGTWEEGYAADMWRGIEQVKKRVGSAEVAPPVDTRSNP